MITKVYIPIEKVNRDSIPAACFEGQGRPDGWVVMWERGGRLYFTYEDAEAVTAEDSGRWIQDA